MSFPLGSWLRAIASFAPYILPAIPGIPAPMVPFIIGGIQAAEQIPGASGEQKLAASVAIAQAGFGAAQAAGAHVDAKAVSDALPVGVSAVVQAVNAFHSQPAPAK